MTAAVSNPEEELLNSVVESVLVKSDEPSSAYEEMVISHSTAIQNERNLVHQDFRRRESSGAADPRQHEQTRLYSDVLLVKDELGEPTHILHNPTNRVTIRPSENDYTVHKLQRNCYQDTLILNQSLQDACEERESESEEDLEDLPRFRSRLEPCGPRARESARAAIRSGTLSGDDIEIMRRDHEQGFGISMLNELRDTTPKLTIVKPGNSMFYETAFPLRTPMSTAAEREVSAYENTDYFTRLVIPVNEENLTISFEHYSSSPIEEESDEPIYSEPIKPKTKKISRSECEDILEKRNVGSYMLRRNKETIILSVKVHTKVKHIKLEFDKDIIKVGKESFKSLPEMIKFYQNSVPVSMLVEPVYLTQEVDSQGLVK